MVPGFSVTTFTEPYITLPLNNNTPDSFLNFIILISVRIFLHNGISLIYCMTKKQIIFRLSNNEAIIFYFFMLSSNFDVYPKESRHKAVLQ